MSFGFSVGDFLAVGELAWRVYKATKDAPKAFHNVHHEVLSLHAVLKEAQETISQSPLPQQRRARLETVVEGCNTVLDDIQKIVDKYEGCAVQTRWTWERLQWSKEDIVGLRSRLISHVTMLTAIMSISQAYVEQRLDKYLNDCQRGRREGSIASTHTVDSVLRKDRAAWRAICKDLEEAGITAAAFKANRDFITDWFIHAAENGDFEEKESCRPEGHTVGTTKSLLEPRAAKGFSDRSRKALAHRAAIALQAASRPDARLFKYTKRGDYDEILRIIARPLINDVLAPSTLAWVLISACWDACNEATIMGLLQSGAWVNGYDSRKGKKNGEWDMGGWHYGINCSPLMAAAYLGEKEVVMLLLRSGASINFCREEKLRTWASQDRRKCSYPSMRPTPLPTPLGCAIAQNHLATVQILVSAGASINKGVEGFTPLHQACMEPGITKELCQELLKWGAEIDAPGSYCGTPLMLALDVGDLERSRLLLDNGANANYRMEDCNPNGLGSPIEVAMSRVTRLNLAYSLSAVELLKEYGAVLDSQQKVALALLEADATANSIDHDSLRTTPTVPLVANPSSTTTSA